MDRLERLEKPRPAVIGEHDPDMLTETQIERYSRQIILQEVGGRGQEKLLSARVAIVTPGTSPAMAAAYLSAAGIGRLAIADPGRLPKSTSHTDAPESAATGGPVRPAFTTLDLAALNPDCTVSQLPLPLTTDDAARMARQSDVVIVVETCSHLRAAAVDGTALLNAACLALRKPLLWARVAGVVACMTQVTSEPAAGPCYRCLLPQLPQVDSGAGAPWASTLTANVIGTAQATEAIKILLGLEATLPGRLVTWNWSTAAIEERRVVQDPGCVACGVTAGRNVQTGAG